MSTARQLEGRIAIVAGGASGLGEAICRRFAQEGAKVIVADIDTAEAMRVSEEIAAGGGTAGHIAADVTDSGQVQALVKAAEEWGGLHILVLSAAVEVTAPITETSDEDWLRVINTNLRGPFLCMKYGMPVMAKNGGGSVIALGSPLGEIGAPGYPAYCASKGALVNLCKQAASEEARNGVRVNVLSPSACDVGLFRRVAEASGDGQAVMESVAAGSPMGRLGTAEDVANAALFLAGDQSAYISGAVLPVDGGAAARRE